MEKLEMTDTKHGSRHLTKFANVGELGIYTVAAMIAARLTRNDILRAAGKSLSGKTDAEPTDMNELVDDIALRGFHLGADGMAWGISDERHGPARDFVLVRLGRPFDADEK